MLLPVELLSQSGLLEIFGLHLDWQTVPLWKHGGTMSVLIEHLLVLLLLLILLAVLLSCFYFSSCNRDELAVEKENGRSNKEEITVNLLQVIKLTLCNYVY